jgi:Domain of unknown function (DUF4304)
MDAAGFRKLVSAFLAPELRKKGWKGSGFNFYQEPGNHVVNILGIQGSWYGGSVCCETAIHFDFIPDLAQSAVNVPKIKYASCLIRKRLHPKGDGDYHWYFRDKDDENVQSIKQIFQAFEHYGEKFYADFKNFPFPFDTITPENVISTKHYKILDKYHIRNAIDLMWLLKEINLFIGRRTAAEQFSAAGILMTEEHERNMIASCRSKFAIKQNEQYFNLKKEKFRI